VGGKKKIFKTGGSEGMPPPKGDYRAGEWEENDKLKTGRGGGEKDTLKGGRMPPNTITGAV